MITKLAYSKLLPGDLIYEDLISRDGKKGVAVIVISSEIEYSALGYPIMSMMFCDGERIWNDTRAPDFEASLLCRP